jgi:hypothetical protein
MKFAGNMTAIAKVVRALCMSLILATSCIPLMMAQSDDSPDPANKSLPQILDFNISPQELMLDSSTEDVALKMRIVDDGCDIKSIEAVFCSPSRNQSRTVLLGTSDLISGNARDGYYAANMSFSPSSETGTWTLDHILACDQTGNCKRFDVMGARDLGFPSELQISKNAESPALLGSMESYAGVISMLDPNELQGWANTEKRFAAQKKIIINNVFNRPAMCWP